MASGHWLYAFFRSDPLSGQCFLVAVNLHWDQPLQNVRIRFPDDALEFIGALAGARATLVERLSTNGQMRLEAEPLSQGAFIPVIPPLTPFYFELRFDGA